MKISALSRSLDQHAPARKGDAAPQSHNLDPALHPFDKAREYTRALAAAKLERMHAKPFVAALDGHADGVYSLALDARRLGVAASGSGDGEIRLWDIASRSCLASYPRAHSGLISSLIISPLSFGSRGSLSAFATDASGKASSRMDGRRLLSAGTDRVVRMWDADPRRDRWGGGDEEDDDAMDLTAAGNIRGVEYNEEKKEAIQSWTSPQAINSLSHHAKAAQFVSASSSIQLWDVTRGSSASASAVGAGGALRTMEWGAESINVVRFNPSETEVLASAGSDRGVVLYDLRSGKPTTKMVMSMRANDIAWSPLEPTTFALASEDHNVYTFDMRNLQSATQIYKSHVAAVMSVGYSPTGQELVSGSYDRTLRLWTVNAGSQSRDVYHLARMQRIFACAFTYDARFVVSASDDGNVRLFKARAGEKLGIQSGRERAALEYRQRLKDKWGSTGDVRKIERQRNIPKQITGASKLKRTMLEAERVKEERRRKHTKAGSSKPKAARKAAILAHKE
ncbi:WD40 repeat-like protein [Tilletiopsis washingtonensis]|uniref:DDB1- and CUL4-associated factor 13 n=1 Tax=Tilletiopsis washingtonensis TaxID=58919 RepID=A0A316Z1G6_9BASI|nr:WD40 repeat-like protein [Tilletiopsis washingtonensis]PWN95617.1 WD40 repeat-like protein [Tilletiopsis washingtonensis]